MKKEVIVAGASPDSGNLGVSALCRSAVESISENIPKLDVNILDFKNGVRSGAYKMHGGGFANLIGANLSKKVYKQSAYSNIKFFLDKGLSVNKTVGAFLKTSCILDVSGGDSFTDMYGQRRFEQIAYPKEMAIKNGIPLILLPQTFGPFKSEENLKRAVKIIKASDLVFARDKYSYAYLKSILKEDFDLEKIKLGVDMAFLLKCKENTLLARSLDKELFGINVSGLLYNSDEDIKSNYEIDLNYKQLMKNIVENVLNESDGRIVLVPHVITADVDNFESDVRASLDLKESLSGSHQERVDIITGSYDEQEIKYVISCLDWFCGSRMHATIAALSTGVPTVNIAYSGKSKGVFASVSQEEKVLDARDMTGEELLLKIINEWRKRKQTKEEIAACLPEVITEAKTQFQIICDRILKY
ncbi:polysaccharide pyruvyl transferase family protein [Amphritea sp.]|uniref:polysaccharide pyruvyl transferase family protein n=1 Tax=Amphritea sp. TaxID=1872502 RepID=UPI0025BDE6DE|nr:polysaccharide pyruvyl transferase family protein [Amphritea sp.]